MFNNQRARKLNAHPYRSGPVVYWMSREQRVQDNWSLVYAAEKARSLHVPLHVIFNIIPQFLEATDRQYRFMITGLKAVQTDLETLSIRFHLLQGDPGTTIPDFLRANKAGLLVTDFDPLTIKRQWQRQVLGAIQIPMVLVDAHNIVPCWITSDKQEYAAYTIRTKIHKRLFEFMEPFPALSPHLIPSDEFVQDRIDWDSISLQYATGSRSDAEQRIVSGEAAAHRTLDEFIQNRLSTYDTESNDPVRDGISGLSPYIHFGQISAQCIALSIDGANAPNAAKDVFLEQLIVRRELAENFCFYSPHYNSVDCFPEWARKSIDEHRGDHREYLYSEKKFEAAETHDPLWNACQLDMMITGKMHGYLRMYWAKKILEWTSAVEEAMETAITLNDRYSLDGRDPNGYAGIAWSIGGVHDRAWGNRPVFGKVRYMNEKGCRRKFEVDTYIDRINHLQ